MDVLGNVLLIIIASILLSYLIFLVGWAIWSIIKMLWLITYCLVIEPISDWFAMRKFEKLLAEKNKNKEKIMETKKQLREERDYWKREYEQAKLDEVMIRRMRDGYAKDCERYRDDIKNLKEKLITYKTVFKIKANEVYGLPKPGECPYHKYHAGFDWYMTLNYVRNNMKYMDTDGDLVLCCGRNHGETGVKKMYENIYLNNVNEKLKKENEELKEENKKLKKKYDDLYMNCNDVINNSAKLQEELAASKDNNKRYVDNNFKLREENKTLLKRVETLQAEVDQLDYENEEFAKDKAWAEEKYEHIVLEKAKLEDNINKLIEQYSKSQK